MSRKQTNLMVRGVFVLILLALVIPNYIRARSGPASAACLNNLRQIEGAKETWALENHKSTN